MDKSDKKNVCEVFLHNAGMDPYEWLARCRVADAPSCLEGDDEAWKDLIRYSTLSCAFLGKERELLGACGALRYEHDVGIKHASEYTSCDILMILDELDRDTIQVYVSSDEDLLVIGCRKPLAIHGVGEAIPWIGELEPLDVLQALHFSWVEGTDRDRGHRARNILCDTVEEIFKECW